MTTTEAWANIGLVVAGGAVAGITAWLNAYLGDKRERRVEADRRAHENRALLADLYARFLTGATEVASDSLRLAEHRRPGEVWSGIEFEALYAPAYRLRVEADADVARAVEELVAKVGVIQELREQATRPSGARPSAKEREAAWNEFVRSLTSFIELTRA